MSMFDNFKGIFGTRETERDINRMLLQSYQIGIESDLDCAVLMLDSALGKSNLILNRKNIRTILTQDEEIDTGVLREKLERLVDEIKALQNAAQS